jgi:hypothetical protein
MIPERLMPKFLHDDEEVEISTDFDRIRHLPEGPLKMARFALWWARKTIFTKPKPENPAFFVTLPGRDASSQQMEEALVELLGEEYFEPGWEISYSYRNEKLNLRRVQYVASHAEHPAYKWWQVHLRGYFHGKGERYGDEEQYEYERNTFELAPHFEVEPTEYPRAHVGHVGLEIDPGAEALRDILDAKGIEYEYRYPNGESVVSDTPVVEEGGTPGDGAEPTTAA